MTRDTDARSVIAEVGRRLDPQRGWTWAIARLDELFRAGRVPDPPLDGYLAGGPLVISAWEPADLLSRRVPGPHRRWEGKRFDAGADTGINVLGAPRVERFPFRTSVGQAATVPGLEVLRLDYAVVGNPAWIRPLRDELVEVAAGCYVGRIHVRVAERDLPVGFFTLQR